MRNDQIICTAVADHAVLLTLGRFLDNSNAHEMISLLTDLQSKGNRFVVIDMSNLELLSSAGVGSLIGTVEGFRGNGGDIILCDLPAPILHVLKVLDLDEYFTIKPTKVEAQEACSVS